MSMVRATCAAVLAATIAAAAAGQAPQTPPASVPAGPAQGPPVFKGGIDQVVIDVVVTDADGRVVPGLTAADFELLDDGKPQPLATFTEVALPLAPRAAGGVAPRPGDVRTNRRVAEGRTYVLLLDDFFVLPGRTPAVKRVAHDFVDRYVQPGDLVAVVTTSGLADGSQPFTEDMALVKAAIDRFLGKKGKSSTVEKIEAAYRAREQDPMRQRRGATNTFNRDAAAPEVNSIDAEHFERARAALRTVEGVAESMSRVSGKRKAVILVSEGVDVPIRAGDSADLSQDVAAIMSASARANVTIYALDPRGLHGMGDEKMEIRALPSDNTIGSGNEMAELAREQRVSADMLRALADGTGGVAAIDTNSLDRALDRIAAESSHYYLAGYPLPDGKRDGRVRAIEVRVKRPGLHVSVRKGYATSDRRDAKADLPKGLRPELDALLKRPLPTEGLPLAVHAVALPVAKDNVAVTIEIGSNAIGFAPKGDKVFNALDVAILPVDGLGKTHGLAQGHPQLTLSEAVADAVLAHGLRLSHRLTLAPGDYQLRIVVREANGGASGSVICDLSVPDLGKPGLFMTPILTSSSGASAIPSAYTDEVLMRALGGPATTQRSFASDETLSAYAELMDAGAKESRDVDILTIVRDADGRDVVKSPQPKANQSVAPGQSFAYAVDLPLKALAPGRYTLRVEARASGLAEPLARELAFDVRSASP